MKRLPHPTFAAWFQRAFLRAWVVIALLFALALIPFSASHKVFGALMALGFAVALIGTLAHLFYQLFHTRCPHCNQPMKTLRDEATYTAVCPRCDTTWDLGIGVGGTD